MTDIYVDLDALQQLANRLALIKESLHNAKDNVQDYGAALGSPRVADKLEDFVHGWKDGRKKIEDNVDKLVDKVKGVAETYLDQENQLARMYESGTSASCVPKGR